MRRSPLHERHVRVCTQWIVVNGMDMPDAYPREIADARVVLADISCGLRAGLKGTGAAMWLANRGIVVPGRPNSWVTGGRGNFIARLGEQEFMLDDMDEHGAVAAVAGALLDVPVDVYPVLRQDVSLLLRGPGVGDVLLETCSLDFRGLSVDRGDLALTTMVGVPVLVAPVSVAPVACRIWADPSFGPYLWDTLLEIVESHGGTAAGWSQLEGCRLP